MLLLLLPHPAGSFDLCGVWPQPAGPCSDWYCPLWPGSASLPPWIGWPSSRWSISVSATRRISSFWPESVRLMGNGIQLKWLGVSLVNIVFYCIFFSLKNALRDRVVNALPFCFCFTFLGRFAFAFNFPCAILRLFLTRFCFYYRSKIKIKFSCLRLRN